MRRTTILRDDFAIVEGTETQLPVIPYVVTVKHTNAYIHSQLPSTTLICFGTA